MVENMDGTGDVVTPAVMSEILRVEGSREYYKKRLFQSEKLNSLLKCALKEKGVSNRWIKKAWYIPIEDCTRGSRRATDVLIYSKDDFREISFGLHEPIDIAKYMKGVAGHVDPHQLEVRPSLYPPNAGKVTQSIDVLLRGFWGWYSESNCPTGSDIRNGKFWGKKEPIAEVWEYEPSISSCDGISYLAFYTKIGSWLKGVRKVEVGWVYFPVEKQYEEALQTLLRNSITSLR